MLSTAASTNFVTTAVPKTPIPLEEARLSFLIIPVTLVVMAFWWSALLGQVSMMPKTTTSTTSSIKTPLNYDEAFKNNSFIIFKIK